MSILESKKIIAIVAVVIVVVAAVAIAVSMSGNNKDSDATSGTSIIGRVNTDGSGIFVKEGVDGSNYATISTTEPSSDEYYLGEDGCYVVFNKEAWGGSVFGVPATSSIQYIQLGEVASCMGLNYQQYVAGQSTNADTLYYIAGVTTYDRFVSTLTSSPAMVGAIVWEPQYSVAILAGCDKVALTNEMFPGHTCCIIGASNSYLANHSDETVRFLAAYVETVTKMNEVITAGSGSDYEYLIQVAMDNVAMTGTDAEKRAAIESAFELVVYTYADGTGSDPLSDLKSDIASLAVSLYDAGAMRYNYSDLGFSSATELANKFVDSSYMVSALAYTKQSSYETANITVAVIGGDIHQLAIHYGIALGIFSDYGINVTLSSQSAGPAVYTVIHNGNADIGFLGAPPMTINAMNDKAISA